jgi:hypothetical protein
MKKSGRVYCLYCGKPLKKNKEDGSLIFECVHCHKDDSPSSLSSLDSHEYKQLCHNEITKYRDVRNSGLSMIILGFIALVLGSIFLLLSFKYNVVKDRVFRPNSLEFVFSLLMLTAASVLLSLGFTRLGVSLIRTKYFSRKIEENETLINIKK